MKSTELGLGLQLRSTKGEISTALQPLAVSTTAEQCSSWPKRVPAGYSARYTPSQPARSLTRRPWQSDPTALYMAQLRTEEPRRWVQSISCIHPRILAGTRPATGAKTYFTPSPGSLMAPYLDMGPWFSIAPAMFTALQFMVE